MKWWNLKIYSEDTEKPELSYIVGGNIKWYNHLRKLIGHFILKLNIYLPYDSVNLLLIIYPRGIKSQVYEMDMIMFTMAFFIHNSPKLETTQMSINNTYG